MPHACLIICPILCSTSMVLYLVDNQGAMARLGALRRFASPACLAFGFCLLLGCLAFVPSWIELTAIAHTRQTEQALGSAATMHDIPAYTVHKTNPDPYQRLGGFYTLDMQHNAPDDNSGKFEERHRKCHDFAVKTEEPLTELHRRRHGPPQPLPGGVPRSFFRWEGSITREEFDAVPARLPRSPTCAHCGPTSRYQIIDGHLYRLGPIVPRNQGGAGWLVSVAEDVILTAIHLFDLPDMDFIVHYDDSCPPSIPVLSYNICRHKPRAGFSFPSYTAWLFALGPHQLKVYHQCLANRYPLNQRRPVVLWRGSTTDPYLGPFGIGIAHKVTRMNIHKHFNNEPALDARLSQVILSDKCTQSYLQPLADPIELEDFNTAAIIMDVDGNGWSDRMSRTAHFPSPILKQASNHTAFFEHLLAPGHAIEYYANDLSDLKERANALMKEWQSSPARLQRQAEQRQGMALAMLNNVAVAEAAAFSLLEYSKRITWKVVRDPKYEPVHFAEAHGRNRLPQQLKDEMKARPPRP